MLSRPVTSLDLDTLVLLSRLVDSNSSLVICDVDEARRYDQARSLLSNCIEGHSNALGLSVIGREDGENGPVIEPS